MYWPSWRHSYRLSAAFAPLDEKHIETNVTLSFIKLQFKKKHSYVFNLSNMVSHTDFWTTPAQQSNARLPGRWLAARFKYWTLWRLSHRLLQLPVPHVAQWGERLMSWFLVALQPWPVICQRAIILRTTRIC